MTKSFGFKTAILSMIAGIFVIVPSTAYATAPARSSEVSAQSVTASVMLSTNPQAAFDALSSAERAQFLDSFEHQSSTTVINEGGQYAPTAAEREAMTNAPAPPELSNLAASSASGCWYRYWYKQWSDLGIHDGDSWLQLNWCGSGGQITSWSQSNYGCDGHYGATCSPQGRADLDVGWEVRSTRYYRASFFGYGNSICMQIRGGATGLYSENSSNSGACPLT